jgi:hypothetical protein
MPRKKKELTPKEPLKEFYTLTVWQDGSFYTTTAEFPEELLPAIKQGLPQIKARVLVELEYKGKKSDMQVLAWPFKRILNNRIGQEILLKRLLMKLNS